MECLPPELRGQRGIESPLQDPPSGQLPQTQGGAALFRESVKRGERRRQTAINSVTTNVGHLFSQGEGAAKEVKSLQEQIETIERAMEGKRIELYLKAYTKLEQEGPEGAKAKLEKQQNMMEEEDADIAYLFDKQKSALEKLLSVYNQLVEKGGKDKRDDRLIATLKGKIDDIQTLLARRDSSLHSMRPVEHRIRLVQAALYKRIELVERRQELDLIIQGSWLALAERFERRAINSTLRKDVDRASEEALSPSLGARIWALFRSAQPQPSAESTSALERVVKSIAHSPTLGEIEQIAKEIGHDLKQESVIYSKKEARALHKAYDEQFDWWAGPLYEGLTSADNWLPIRRLIVQTSSSGTVHAFAKETTPCDLNEGSGVPSGLRQQEEYKKRTTNFHKTTFYKIGDEEQTTTVSYRGGQFPTQEAAKAALLTMMRETKNGHLHINSLLTPTALSSFSPDKELLAQHRSNFKCALREIHQALCTPYGKLTETQKAIFDALAGTGIDHAIVLKMLQETFPLSNFGVNDGAVGEKLPFHLSLGWHTATKEYNNEAAAQLGVQLSDRLSAIKAKIDSGKELTGEEERVLGHLGSLVSACQELQGIWDSNSFARSREGDDPFKMPALWATIDMLAGITTYTNCMSGKDRTGEVVAAAHHRYAEFLMEEGMEEDKREKELGALLDRHNIDDKKLRSELLLCRFTPEELERELELCELVNPANLPRLKRAQAVEEALEALNLNDGGEGPLMQKEVSSFLQVGTRGISTRTSNRIEQRALSPEERDRLAKNRRAMTTSSGASAITRRNTSVVGTKVQGRGPLLRYSSGFDRESLLAELVSPGGRLFAAFKETFAERTGLDELSKSQKEEILNLLSTIEKNNNGRAGKNVDLRAALTQVIKKVEHLKRGAVTPSAKVAG